MAQNILRSIIVEDELGGRNALKAILKQFPEVLLVGEASNAEEARVLIAELKPDLLLLDIEMPFKNGFELLSEIPDRTFDVIFTTAYDSYAIRAIKFSAIDYLLKPVDPEELQMALERVLEKKNHNSYQPQLQIENLLDNLKSIHKQNFKLSLPTAEGTLFIPIEEIMRCESDANYTRFFFKDGTKPVVVSKTLKEFEELLSDYGFCRIHNSHMINLKFIRRYIRGEGGTVVMLDGTEVEVSRRKKEIFQKALEKETGFI
jgi:two-component system, LytTR family, response regulator